MQVMSLLCYYSPTIDNTLHIPPQEHMERCSTQHLQLLSEQVTKVKQMMQAERVLSREGEDSSQPQPQPRLIK